MLERMDAFFDARTGMYEEHMRRDIVGSTEFYPETARRIAPFAGMKLLDIGCGTGLELDEIYALCPQVDTVGIDLSEGMLAVLRQKEYAARLHLIRGSYFDVPFGECIYDRAVSVETLHHFPAELKTALYAKIHAALKSGGYYAETDYVAPSQEAEDALFAENARLRREQGIADGEFYHFDTPHTVKNLTAMLLKAGFVRVEHVYQQENTAILIAYKKGE